MQVKAGSKAELVCTDKDGKETRELIYDFSNEDGIIQGVHNRDESIASFAKACFNYNFKEIRPSFQGYIPRNL